MPRPLTRIKAGLRRRNLFLLLVGLTLLSFCALGLHEPSAYAATTFTVNTLGDGADSDLNDGVCNDGTGQCTLRAAVEQANQLTGSDTINITVNGTINLTSALPNLSSLTITGPGAAQLTVRRDPSTATNFRIFRTDSATTVNITGITISGGHAVGDGGGIYSISTNLTLLNVVVSDNVTEGFSTTDGRGAGIYHTASTGTLTLTNCTVSGNSASNGFTFGGADGRNGGGIYIDRGTLNITNSTISGNKAGNRANNGSLSVNPGFGGGVYVSSSANATFTSSTISGNQSGQGGGGGGIYHDLSSPSFPLTLNSCTVTGNTAGGGGGVVSLRANIRNTIVANNTANTNPDVTGTFNSQDFNLIRSPGTATINGTTTHNVTGLDPLLSPLQNNGGPTQTHALLPGSPAIDAGDRGGLNADQRGLTRPVDNTTAANASDGADIGAYEVQAPPSAGQLQFSAAAYTAAEGAGDATITVTRTDGSAGAVSVTFAAADGTAVAGADYTAAANFTVTFAGGDTAPKIVNVPVTDDLLDEPDETVNLTLSNPTGGATLVGSPATATLTITDNDPVPSLSVSDVTVTEGDAGRTPADFVVSLSGASGKTVSVMYSVGGGTASGNGDDFTPTFGTLTFAPGETSKTVTVPIRGDARFEPDETVYFDLSFPTNATVSDARGVGTILNDDSAATKSVQFSDYQFQTGEGPYPTTITLYRVGDLSAEASVDYSTSDGTATDRGDYTSVFGRVTFPAGSDFAHFDVFVTDDRFHEGDETFTLTLSNPAGVTLGAGSTTTLVIARDDDATDGTSPITLGPSFDTTFFVRQHYRDFLGRDSDSAGQDFWYDEINNCGADARCKEVKRINVSAAFFLSIEFQQTGYLAYRAHKAAFANLAGKPVPITREEMLRDMSALGAGLIVGAQGWEQKLERNKQAYFTQLAASARFASLYPQTLTPEQFVDALNANAGGALSPAERDALVADLKGNAKTRAQVLRAAAEDEDLSKAEFNKAFVLMQFFGYLRRDPDSAPDTDFSGYNFWLGKLNEFGGNYIQAEMVKAFLDSIEYKQRFGQ
ncbi:MAG: Calx-beta domain-containing protein [Pyrinomonadaceae bacterium]